MNTEEKKENTEVEENLKEDVSTKSAEENEHSLENTIEQEEENESSSAENLKKTIADLTDRTLRLLAENQNLRKNHEKEKEDILKYGSFNFASQILALTDNLDRAFAIFKNNEKFKDTEFLEITHGIELIEKELITTLEKNNTS